MSESTDRNNALHAPRAGLVGLAVRVGRPTDAAS